jgi:hypothetical protein
MRRSNQRPGRYAAAGLLAVCLGLSAAGCGSDGTADVTLIPTPRAIVPAVNGTVLAPNGDFAAANSWRRWACAFSLVSPAQAQTCLMDLMPAGGILNVALWQVDFIDAKDGEIDSPRLLSQARTDPEQPGLYEIVDQALQNLDTCRFMVAVGGGTSLTRAFAIDHTTNIDAVSEAPVQLCDFTTAALANIVQKVRNAACSAKGDTVAEINQSAYDHALVNCGVLQAINDATGVPVPLPAKCL